MKKDSVALWGTNFAGAFICILCGFYFHIDILAIAASVISLICMYFFLSAVWEGKKDVRTGTAIGQRERIFQGSGESADGLEKKLDELIFVQKAVYTILKKEAEEKESVSGKIEGIYEKLEELLAMQERNVKILVKYSKEDAQNQTDAINEEIIKVQKVLAVQQRHLANAIKEVGVILKYGLGLGKNTEGTIGHKEEAMKAAADFQDSTKSQEEISSPASEEGRTSELELEEEPMIIPESELEEEPIVVPEPELEEEPMIIPELELEEEPMVIPEPELELEEEPIPAPVPEPAGDPNRAMSADEIAALIASMK